MKQMNETLMKMFSKKLNLILLNALNSKYYSMELPESLVESIDTFLSNICILGDKQPLKKIAS